MVAVLWRCRWGRLCFGGVGGAVWSHGCCGRRRPRPPARLGGLTSFGAAPRSPPVPSGPSGALHTCRAGSLIGVSARSPVRPRRRPWARSQAVPTRWPACLKPLSPLQAQVEPQLKPSSPLRVRNGCFWCSFRVQWRCRFQRPVVGGVQWCCWFQCRHGVVPGARKSSPGGAVSSRKCEKVRPARSNWPEIGVFALAGRVFSRKSRWRGCSGRVFSRQPVLRPGLVGSSVHFSGWLRWGFCAMRSPLTACRRRVGGLDGVIHPVWR